MTPQQEMQLYDDVETLKNQVKTIKEVLELQMEINKHLNEMIVAVGDFASRSKFTI